MVGVSFKQLAASPDPGFFALILVSCIHFMYYMWLKGDVLEDPANEPKKDMYMLSVDPEDAPNQPE